jgi:uncharacterized membrane protein
MSRLLNYFLKGLALVVPLALTIYVCVAIFSTIDGWLGLPIPGAGFVLTIALITVVGFLASNLIARSVLGMIERLFNRLPLVRLLYSSTKDMLDAFVGEKKRFDKPVLVTLAPHSNLKSFGFVTQEAFTRLGVAGDVVVYIPQSYGFAGNLAVVPASHVVRIDADAADVMAFIISGGVTEVAERPPRGIPSA